MAAERRDGAAERRRSATRPCWWWSTRSTGWATTACSPIWPRWPRWCELGCRAVGPGHRCRPSTSRSRPRPARVSTTLVDAIVARMPEGPQYYPDDMVTDVPEAFWVAELVREQLLPRVEDELPHTIACRVTEWEWPRVRCEILVERDSQKGIVIGKGGERPEGGRHRRAPAAARGRLPRAVRAGGEGLAAAGGRPRPVGALTRHGCRLSRRRDQALSSTASTMASKEKFRATCRCTRGPAPVGSAASRAPRRASPPGRPASPGGTRNRAKSPVRISGMPPDRRGDRPGDRCDIASITVRPKGSSQTEGTTTTSAACSGVTTSVRMGSWWMRDPVRSPRTSWLAYSRPGCGPHAPPAPGRRIAVVQPGHGLDQDLTPFFSARPGRRTSRRTDG